jgi:hypothetical protein
MNLEATLAVKPAVSRSRVASEVNLTSVSRAQRSTSEAKWCAADPGPSKFMAVPDQRRVAPLRFALRRIPDTQSVAQGTLVGPPRFFAVTSASD